MRLSSIVQSSIDLSINRSTGLSNASPMEFSEHPPEQPNKLKGSIDKAESRFNELTNPEKPHQTLTSSNSSLIDGGTADTQAGLEKPDGQQRLRDKYVHGSWSIGRDDFDWTEDLSENGQKLFLLLINDIGLTKYLPELAEQKGIELASALEELRRNKIIDESDPTIIRIIRRRL